jgi:hypothetical protein
MGWVRDFLRTGFDLTGAKIMKKNKNANFIDIFHSKTNS